MEDSKTVHVANRTQELHHDIFHEFLGYFVGVYIVKQVSALTELGHYVEMIFVTVDIV